MTTLLETPGMIVPDAVYTKEEFCRRVNWKQHAWRGARRRGLRVIETGGRVFVRGADWLDYLEAVASGEFDDTP